MNMYQRESILQYWHSKLNKKLFNNELEVAKIIVRNDEEAVKNAEEGIEARYIDWYGRDYIVFYPYTWMAEEPETDNETIEVPVSVYDVTVLLHEMVHQYCNQNGIDDIDLNGKHNENFREAAEKHGLTQYGYQLQAGLEDEIDAELTWFREWGY